MDNLAVECQPNSDEDRVATPVDETPKIRASDKKITRALTFRYVAVLLLLAALAIIDNAVLSKAISVKGSDSSVVNIGGRQRMLSQRVLMLTNHLGAMSKTSQLSKLEAVQKDLERAINLMESSHQYLVGEGALSGRFISEEIRSLYFGPRAMVDQDVRIFIKSAKAVLAFSDHDQIAPGPHPQMDLAANNLLLNSLNAVVEQYERESERRVLNFRDIQNYLLGFNLFVLFLSAVAVFRPLVDRIHQYIGEQRQAERSLRHQTSIQRMLHAITSAANLTNDMDETFRLCLAEVCAFTGWPVGHAYVVSDSRRGLLVSTKIWHVTDSELYAKFIDTTEEMEFSLGVGLPGRVLATQRSGWIVDIVHDKNFPRHKISKDVGLRSGFAFPVIVDNETEAVLEFFTPEIIDPDHILLQALEDAGVQIGRMLERRKAGMELRESEQRYHSIANSPGTAMIIARGENGVITSWNPAAETMFGYEKNEIVGSPLNQIIPQRYREAHSNKFNRAFQTKGANISGKTIEMTGLRKDGSEFPLELSLGTWNSKGETYFSGVIHDITERKLAEQTLQRSQKMDAVGQLTGGIAHDFNNILGIVSGNLEILQRLLADNPKALKWIESGLKSTERGAVLTRKLLGFSRKTATGQKITQVNEFIYSLQELLKRSLTTAVNVETHLDDDLWPVKIDAADFEDAILNLSLNARDAMPNGGTLSIETSNKTLDKSYLLKNPTGSEGDFVRVTVSDNGMGMTPGVMEKVFDPFFSTKDTDKGTGLGLSMVYGFVRRSGGHIDIYSEPGEGTAFHLYLPRSHDKVEQLEQADHAKKIQHGDGETILVVDDEKDLVDVAVSHLSGLGYETLTAYDGEEALKLVNEKRDIDLLFSDVVMPGGIDGFRLALETQKKRPELKILMTSGFTKLHKSFERDKEYAGAALADNLLSKPYSREELAISVRKALDSD